MVNLTDKIFEDKMIITMAFIYFFLSVLKKKKKVRGSQKLYPSQQIDPHTVPQFTKRQVRPFLEIFPRKNQSYAT
jgi:hypothetical protein